MSVPTALQVIVKPVLRFTPDMARNRQLAAAAGRVQAWLRKHEIPLALDGGSSTASKDDVERLGRYDAIFRLIDAHNLPVVLSTPTNNVMLNNGWARPRLVPISADASHPGASRPILDMFVDQMFHENVPYAFSDAFRKHCGREFILAGIGDMDTPELKALPSYTKIGRTMPLPFVMKTVTRQKASSVLFVETEEDREDVPWAVMHLDGHVAAFQSKLDIVSEHRCLVIDGSIEEIVQQIDDATFATPAPKVSYHEELRGIADALLADLLTDSTLGRTFTLDVARLTTGEVVIMELNPLGGAGFFSGDVDALMSRMVSVALGHPVTPVKAA
jgi:hypothetical protein